MDSQQITQNQIINLKAMTKAMIKEIIVFDKQLQIITGGLKNCPHIQLFDSDSDIIIDFTNIIQAIIHIESKLVDFSMIVKELRKFFPSSQLLEKMSIEITNFKKKIDPIARRLFALNDNSLERLGLSFSNFPIYNSSQETLPSMLDLESILEVKIKEEKMDIQQ